MEDCCRLSGVLWLAGFAACYKPDCERAKRRGAMPKKIIQLFSLLLLTKAGNLLISFCLIRKKQQTLANKRKIMAENKLTELKQMIAGTIAAYPDKKQCWKAMQAIQWRLRGPNGEYVGINKQMACSFVPEDDSLVFDGRDNEDIKLATYQRALGNLAVEIIPQVVAS
jgi:hypothetical protein